MTFTKVAPAGIGTSPGNSILIGDSLLHSTGIDIGSNTGAGVTIRQHGDATFTGIVTATKFVGSIEATTATFSGNLGVGGVLTYEDVTNIDSVGVVTARSGIKIGPTAGVAGTFFADGSYVTAGVITATSYYGDGSNLSNITSTTINNNADNRLITGSGTANTLNGESELTYSTYLNLTRSNSDTNFGDNSAPGGVNGIFVSNSQSTNGVFSAITLSANDTNGTNQSASFIAKSVNGGYTPEVHISSRTNNNTNESNFKITSNREVQLRYQGSNRAETFDSGFKISGGGELYIDGNAASGHCQIIMTRSDMSYAINNETYLRFYRKSGNSGNPNSLMAEFTNSGHFRPGADNTFDLGDNTRRWRNLYTTDLKLSNEGSQNDVDGTWGNYTIQEGESDLFLINNRNGKKYKFNLTEVS